MGPHIEIDLINRGKLAAQIMREYSYTGGHLWQKA